MADDKATREYLRKQFQSEAVDQEAMQVKSGGAKKSGPGLSIAGIIGSVTGFIGSVVGMIFAPFLWLLRHPKTTVGLIVLGLLGAGGAYIAPNIPLQIQRNEAVEHFKKGEHGQALTKFSAYLRARPSDIEAVYFAAFSAIPLGDGARAKQYLALLSNSPEYGKDGAVNYQYAYYSLDDGMKAVLRILDRGANLSGRPAAAKVLRGVALGLTGEMSRSRDEFLAADSDVRRSAQPHEEGLRQLDTALRERGVGIADYAFAPLPFADPAESWDGDFGVPMMHRGFLNRYFRVGEDAAADSAEGGSALSAEMIVGVYYARALVVNGEFEDARAVLEDLQNGDGEGAPALDAPYILLYLQSGDFGAAAERFAKIAERNPKSASPLLNLANSKWSASPSFSEGAGTEALELYDRVLEKDAKNAVARNNKALLLAAKGEFRKSRELFKRLIKDAESTQKKSAKSAEESEGGENPEGESAPAKAKEEESPLALAEARLNLLQILAQTGSAKEADALYAQVAAETADGKEFLPFVAAKIRHRLGDIDGAEKSFESGEFSGDAGRAMLIQGRHLAESDLLLRARERLKAVIASADLPESQYWAGVVAARLGDLETLKKRAEILQGRGEEFASYASALAAMAALAEGKGEDAAGLFAEAMEQSPSDVRRAVIALQFERGLYAQAKARETLLQYDKSPRLASRPGAGLLLARLLAQDNPRRAKQLLLSPPQPILGWRAFADSGFAYMTLDEKAKGQRMLDKARGAVPANAVLLKRIEPYISEKRKKVLTRTLEYLAQLAAGKGPSSVSQDSVLLPNDSKIQKLAGAALDSPNNSQLVAAVLNRYERVMKATTNENAKLTLRFSRGSFLAAVGRPREALKDLELPDVLPASGRKNVNVFLGEVLVEAGEHKKAESVLRRSAGGKDSPLRRRLYAEVLHRKGDVVKSRKAVNGALRLYPADAGLYLLKARTYSSRGDTEGAVETLRTAVRTGYATPDVYKELSTLLARGGFPGAKSNRLIYAALLLLEKSK